MSWYDIVLTPSVSSTGVTSRGRVGLTSSQLTAGAITNPWFTDPVDKATLISGLQQIANGAAKGSSTTNRNDFHSNPVQCQALN